MSTKQKAAKAQTTRKKLRVNADNDYKLITCVLLLAGFGLVVLYSSSYYSEGISMLLKQAIFTVAGLVLMMLMAEMLDYRILKPWAITLYLISIGMTLLVLTPIGKSINGARRWIDLGITTFQPSEFVKVTVILAVAGILSSYWKRLQKWQISLILAILVLVPVAILFVVTDHLSAAVIVLVIGFGLVFIAHPKDRVMLMAALFVLLVAVVAIYYIVVIKEYSPDESFRYTRIRIWFDPFNEAYDGSYQVREGLYGIASGGLFGRGLGNSILKEGFLPEPYNDMIFAVLCEEMGLLGAGMVLYLFLYLVIRIFRIGVSAPDKFGFFICMGVMLHIASQVILNILVVTNTIMNTGITLCFFSGGGSALLFIYAEMGLVLSVAKRIQNPKI